MSVNIALFCDPTLPFAYLTLKKEPAPQVLAKDHVGLDRVKELDLHEYFLEDAIDAIVDTVEECSAVGVCDLLSFYYAEVHSIKVIYLVFLDITFRKFPLLHLVPRKHILF